LEKYCGDASIISRFLDFIHDHRDEVFLYLSNREVEKTSGIAERHFSVMSYLLKNRFRTKEGLLRMSYWNHYYLTLSTRN
jgi:hypothetical protein